MLATQPDQLNLDLFEDKARWPRRPYCTDDLEYGVRIRSLAHAIGRPYIQANPPHLRIWSLFDIDRVGGALAWEAAGLPPPSWATKNKENGHAHLAWGLRAPVLVDSEEKRQAPLRYLCSIESMMREKMQADPGFSGLITKNPAHPLWQTLRGPQMVFDLAELAEYLPGLEQHIPKRKKPEEVGLGRNITLFDWLRHYAYKHVRHYREEVCNYVHWQSQLNSKALERNGDFLYPLDGKEVWHIAKSVCKWTWNMDLSVSDRRFSALQAHRGKQGGRPRTTTAAGNPWEDAGMSRRTWYRKRASGLLVPVDN